jgi:hypothetical protein
VGGGGPPGRFQLTYIPDGDDSGGVFIDGEPRKAALS